MKPFITLVTVAALMLGGVVGNQLDGGRSSLLGTLHGEGQLPGTGVQLGLRLLRAADLAGQGAVLRQQLLQQVHPRGLGQRRATIHALAGLQIGDLALQLRQAIRRREASCM